VAPATVRKLLLATAVAVGAVGMVTSCRDSPDAPQQQSPATAKHLDPALPVWIGELELAIREDPQAQYIDPIPMGSDKNERSYVLDPHLREVHRFDRAGRFMDVVVRSGEGPGEMRFRPWTFGLTEDGIWYSELPTGRVQFVSFDGTERSVEETGWTPLMLGNSNMWISLLSGWSPGEYLIKAETRDRLVGAQLRPGRTVTLMHAQGEKTTPVYEFSTSGNRIVLDGGATVVRYDGPADHSVLFYLPKRREVVRIDRPAPAGAGPTNIVFTTYGPNGLRRRHQEITVDDQRLTSSHRDSIEIKLLRSASWNGGRTVTDDVKDAVSELVREIPAELPGFETAALSDGQIWLQLYANRTERYREWLVLNTDLEPVARAYVPSDVVRMSVLSDGVWWVTMQGALGGRYVGRILLHAEAERQEADRITGPMSVFAVPP